MSRVKESSLLHKDEQMKAFERRVAAASGSVLIFVSATQTNQTRISFPILLILDLKEKLSLSSFFFFQQNVNPRPVPQYSQRLSRWVGIQTPFKRANALLKMN